MSYTAVFMGSNVDFLGVSSASPTSANAALSLSGHIGQAHVSLLQPFHPSSTVPPGGSLACGFDFHRPFALVTSFVVLQRFSYVYLGSHGLAWGSCLPCTFSIAIGFLLRQRLHHLLGTMKRSMAQHSRSTILNAWHWPSREPFYPSRPFIDRLQFQPH